MEGEQGTDITLAGATEAAWTQAKKSGKRVEVSARNTEFATAWANPDGKTLSMTLSTEPVRVKTGTSRHSWRPIDTTLVEGDKAIEPKRVKGRLVFSSGSNRRLLTVVTGKGTSGIDWPRDLPRPKLNGDSATYTDAVAPGADLVVRALPDTFALKVVLRKRLTSPLAIRLPLTLPEAMIYSRTKDGTPQLVTRDKKKPTARPVAAEVLDAKAGQSPDKGRIGSTVARLAGSGSDPTLVIKPDADFLADSTVQYPVTIAADPVWIGAGLDADTFMCSNGPTTTQIASTYLRAGSNSQGHCRTYLRFPVSDTDIAGGKILNADLRMWNWRSTTCGSQVGSGIVAQMVTSPFDPATFTWSSQPTTTRTGQAANQAAYSDTCSWGEGQLIHSIEQIVQTWADGTTPDYGLLLRGVVENTTPNYRQYVSTERNHPDPRGHAPQLFIEYEPAKTVRFAAAGDDGLPAGALEGEPFIFEDFYDLPGYTASDLDRLRDTGELPGSLPSQEGGDDWTQPVTQEPDPPYYENQPGEPGYEEDPPTDPPGQHTVALPAETDLWLDDTGYAIGDTETLWSGLYSFSGPVIRERAYLHFDTSQLAGKTIIDARLELENSNAFGCGSTGAGLKARRVTSAWTPDTLHWSNQPGLTEDGAAVASDPLPCTEDSPSTGDLWTWPITDMAQAWASGQANHGLVLSAADESDTADYDRGFHSSRTSVGEPPAMVVTYTDSPLATPSQSARLRSAADDPAPYEPGDDLVEFWNDRDGKRINLRDGWYVSRTDDGWGQTKMRLKHNLDWEVARTVTRRTTFGAPGKYQQLANPWRWNYELPIRLVECRGLWPWEDHNHKDCKLLDSTRVRVVVDFSGPKFDGHNTGVITGYCLGRQVCDPWVNEIENPA